MSDERGAGTALALAVVAAVVALFVLLAAVAVVLDARRRSVSVADAAALAGADTALGNASGVPCERAAHLAASAHLRLDACAQRGDLVRVAVSTVVLGLAVRAEAVAGPPVAR